MTTADAYLWTRNRHDKVLQDKFIELTEKQFDNKRGYYGKIGDRTVIKNCRIIKDTWIGTDAYLKGANKIKISPSILMKLLGHKLAKDLNW